MISQREIIYPLQPTMPTSLYTPRQRLSVVSRVAFELERATNVLLANVHASLLAYQVLRRELDINTRLGDDLKEFYGKASDLVAQIRYHIPA
jgi:hypothetical protein